jgi:hypothetical protein
MRIQPAFYVATCVALAAVATAACPRVAACSCANDTIARSDPQPDAQDVPLNAALVVEGHLDLAAVTLQDADGAAVAFDRNTGFWPSCRSVWVELLPKAPLLPDTRYTIGVISPQDARGPGPSYVSFTTGHALLPDETPATPVGRASVATDGPEIGCGGTHFVCLAVEDGDGVELTVRKGDTVLLHALTSTSAAFGLALKQIPDCIEVSKRAATGQRSRPLTLCDSALGIRPWRDSDRGGDEPVVCHDGMLGDPDGSVPSERGESQQSIIAEPTPKAKAGNSGPGTAEAGPAGCAVGTLSAARDPMLLPSWLWLSVALGGIMRRRVARQRR